MSDDLDKEKDHGHEKKLNGSVNGDSTQKNEKGRKTMIIMWKSLP